MVVVTLIYESRCKACFKVTCAVGFAFGSPSTLQFIAGALTAPPYDPSTGFTPAFTPDPGITNWQLPMMVAGANISMRRSLFDRIGGYDEFCGPGSRLRASDDGDITFRMMRSDANWKGCPDIEIVHTHGFRRGQAGPELLLRYEHGNGGIFGRFTRRGDLLAGAWFLLREARNIGRGIISAVRGHPTGFDASKARLLGFWNGVRIPPREGFVSGAELARRRIALQRVSTNVTAPFARVPVAE